MNYLLSTDFICSRASIDRCLQGMSFLYYGELRSEGGDYMFARIILVILMLAISTSAFADCVYGAKDKTSYVVLDTHTILLKGGYGGDIVIKTYCFIYRTSDITVLKDDFCSYESSVLYIDEEVCDANQVTKIQ